MLGEFVIVTESEVWTDDYVDPNLLQEKGLFKTLSLVLAARASVDVPPTLLMLVKRMDIVTRFTEDWGLPLMIRMDFSSLPDRKTLGGIPLYALRTIDLVSEFLLAQGCYPLFHPHLDRFDDIYSAGVIMERSNYTIRVEVVGKGFDASDLRLGRSTPHESLEFDLLENSVISRNIISNSVYSSEKAARERRIQQYIRYTNYANKTGRLLWSLEDVDDYLLPHRVGRIQLPDEYSPLSDSLLRSLVEAVWSLRTRVVSHLPPSESFVASFSLLPNRGWILWDVYGSWYKR